MAVMDDKKKTDMTELTRYNLIEQDSDYGAFFVYMEESPMGEYVRFADVEAYTQAAIAAAMMGAVKPLEWWDCPDFSTAGGQTISYHCISRLDGLYEVKVGNEGDKSPCIDGTYASLEAAKAAAEADWQARNAAIRVIPPDAMAALAERDALRARVAELEGILRQFITLDDDYSPFAGEMFEDRIKRTWERARAALSREGRE